MKHIPWTAFDRLVDEHGADRRVRRLTTKSQLTALLYGQLSGAASLREIEAGLSSHQARLYHIGASRPSRSTLADANARRPSDVFTGLFAHMIGQAQRGLRNRIGEAVRLIDASGLKLASSQQLGAVLRQCIWRQAARHLRSRCRPATLLRGHRRQRQ
jgi:hypothetical protein